VTLTYRISDSLIARYSAGPSVSRTKQVAALQTAIRDALDSGADNKFDTFLQGSYRNNTAIADINDVDILALYDPWQAPATASAWQSLFDFVTEILRRDKNVQGTVTQGDKCVKLAGPINADIVPSISRTPYSSTDPVIIYSRSKNLEIENYPRVHYQNGVSKQAATKDTYKATVRLFKRWVRQFSDSTAPSFYVECAVHSVVSSKFNSYLPLSFAMVGAELLTYSRSTVIKSVADDKDVLVPSEWSPSDFESFQRRLRPDIDRTLRAMQATSASEANALWRIVFGDHE
jgi:hypothetical protein